MPLPQVLAGPIVRRVVGNEVAVWLALRDPAIVELVVWAGPQRSTGPGSVDSGTPSVARGVALTERFGAQLHVVVVVAEAGAIITPGAIHSYDVIVGGQGLRDLGFLRDETPTTESAGNARPLRWPGMSEPEREDDARPSPEPTARRGRQATRTE